MVRRRVVVTGLGGVTPLGKCIESTWKSILHMKEAHSHVMETGHTVYSIPDNYVTTTIPSSNRRISRFVQLALQAGQEALLHSGLLLPSSQQTPHHDHDDEEEEVYEDRGVSIGCGLSCVEEISMAASMEGRTSMKRLSPYFVPKVLLNSAAGQVSMKFNYGGPNLAPTTACAAGSHAIIDAYHCIQRGDANIMLAGGTESCLDPIALSGFHRLKALSSTSTSSPFDVNRNGFIMSEGASILVLEDYQHAIQRNCTTIYAEIIGYGMTADAHHITQPNGYGAQRAMSMATTTTNDVDYINAHATSTPVGDRMEVNAIYNVFSPRQNKPLYVSSTKGATGHLLGAAGALEASLSILSLRDQIIPPTLHLQQPMPEIFINSNHHNNIIYPTQPIHTTNLQTTLSNSFGFGGTNACLLFQKIPTDT